MTSKTATTINPDLFAGLANSFAAITEASAKAAKAREFFSNVDALVVHPRGTVSAQTKESKGMFEFRQKTGEAWSTVKANCVERTLRAYRYADIIGEGGEVTGHITLSFTVKSYLDRNGNIIGVSSKNSRFDKALVLGSEPFRVWGHKNTHQPLGPDGKPKVNDKGEVVPERDYFNVVVASTMTSRKHTEDPFGELPEQE